MAESNQEPRQAKLQTIRGVVTSDKMNKTRVIQVERRLKHGLYQKAVIRHTSIFVHDEKNEAKVGDSIVAIATRRLSKNKAYRLLKVLEKGA